MTFHSTHHALIFEKTFKNKGIEVRLMPVPRQVSSSCGTAAEFPCELIDRALIICKESSIEIDKVHKIEKINKKGWFSKFLEA